MYKDMPNCDLCGAEKLGIIFLINSQMNLCVDCARGPIAFVEWDDVKDDAAQD